MTPRRSNDQMRLEPQQPPAGPALELDFPTLRIGVAEYAEGPTGCTVFHFPAGAALAVDVRGGAPSIVGERDWTQAICLTGGSLYGLEAVAGVAAELFAQREYDPTWNEIALVTGAVIYDFGPRDNAIYPDKALGRAALQSGPVSPVSARPARGRVFGDGRQALWHAPRRGGGARRGVSPRSARRR